MFIRRVFSRLFPMGFLLIIAFLASLPMILSSMKPDAYWFQLSFGAWTRSLELALLITLVIVPVTYLMYRRWRPKLVTQDLSEKELTILFFVDFMQIVLALPLIGYVCLIMVVWTVFSDPDPYQLDTLQHNNFEYSVMLTPYWDKNADYVVYECNLQGEKCKAHTVYVSIGPTESFYDLTQNRAKLGIADNKLFVCIYDHSYIVLVRDVLADDPHPEFHAGNDPLCLDMSPTPSPSTLVTVVAPQQ